MKPFNLFGWLFDVVLDQRGIRFRLFSAWTFHILEFEDIDSVKEIGFASPGSWNAVNFKNSLFARSFIVTTKRGWFSRKMLITPKDPDLFITELRGRGIHC